MNNILSKSNILACLGSIGVIGTTILAVKATPKALKLIEKSEAEKRRKLTKMETIKVAGPVYIPAAITGVSTIACIFGSSVLNKRQQAALMSAYALLDNSYKEYRKKAQDLYESDETIRNEIVKDHLETVQMATDANARLFYDEFSEQYFEVPIETVLKAEYKVNRLVSKGYCVYLNEFYEALGMNTTDYGDYFCWTSDRVEFEHRKFAMEDGLECTIITMLDEPSFDVDY